MEEVTSLVKAFSLIVSALYVLQSKRYPRYNGQSSMVMYDVDIRISLHEGVKG